MIVFVHHSLQSVWVGHHISIPHAVSGFSTCTDLLNNDVLGFHARDCLPQMFGFLSVPGGSPWRVRGFDTTLQGELKETTGQAVPKDIRLPVAPHTHTHTLPISISQRSPPRSQRSFSSSLVAWPSHRMLDKCCPLQALRLLLPRRPLTFTLRLIDDWWSCSVPRPSQP